MGVNHGMSFSFTVFFRFSFSFSFHQSWFYLLLDTNNNSQ